MTDNVTLNAGSGGDTIATEDIGGVEYQRIKLIDGTTSSTTPIPGDGTNGLDVDVTRVIPGTGATNLGKAEDGQHSSGDTGIMTLGVRQDTPASFGDTDGDYVPLSMDSTGALRVNAVNAGGTANSGDAADPADEGAVVLAIRDDALAGIGSPIADGDYTGIRVDSEGKLWVASVSTGNVANDAADSGNPVKIGAHASNSIETETQVANSDRVDIKADLNGVLLGRPHTTLEEIISERVSNTDGASTAFTNFAAGGSGVHNYVTDITVLNTSATDGYVDIRDGTAGSILWTLPLPAGGGATHSFTLPLKGGDNTALAYDVSAALTTVYISVNGFQAQG